MKSTSYANIEPLAPEALWPGFIPLATPTYLAGTGGCGKGLITADIVARVTRGDKMPNGAVSDVPGPGNVMLVLPEDDPNTAVAWRLRAAGADLDRVHDYTRGFSMPSGFPGMAKEMDRIRKETDESVRMIVCDPISAMSDIHLGCGPKKIRAELTTPIEDFCRQRGIALLIIAHYTKDGKTVQGSKTITDAARIVLGARKVKGSPYRQFFVDKANGAQDDIILPYEIVGSATDVHIEWADGVDAENPEQKARDKVAAVLDRTEPGTFLTLQEIQDLARTPYGATRTALTRMGRDGQVVNPDRGYWGRAVDA